MLWYWASGALHFEGSQCLHLQGPCSPSRIAILLGLLVHEDEGAAIF